MELNREDEESARSGGALINEVFICDASAEADRLQAGLRAKNYPVIDVPPGLIGMRIRYERPLAVILDADLKDAERMIQEIREASGGATRVVLIGEVGRALDTPAFPAPLARLRYYRPIDIEAVLADLIELLGPPQQRGARSRAPRAPILMAATRRPVRVDSLGTIPPPKVPSLESENPSRYVPSLPPLPSDAGEILGTLRSRSSPSGRPRLESGGPVALSPETRAVLEQGRRKVRLNKGGSSPLIRLGPTTDAEVPTESPLLQALLRPLTETFEDGDAIEERAHANTPIRAPEPVDDEPTRAGINIEEAKFDSKPAAPPLVAQPDFDDRTNPGPRGALLDDQPDLPVPEIISSRRLQDLAVEREEDASGPKTVPFGRRNPNLDVASEKPESAEDATLGLARAVRERFTGALAQQTQSGLRRILLRDGDVHSVFSSSDADSLVSFLTRQGTLTPETARTLAALPRAARGAGAGVVAAGYLLPDELLPTLRAHAEWLLSQLLTTKSPVIRENLPTERTADEESLFGGMTGAEVFISVIKPLRSVDEALERFGDSETWISLGSRIDLFSEARLESELSLFLEARPLPFFKQLADQDPARVVALSGLLDLGALTRGPATHETLVHSEAIATDRPGRRESLAPASFSPRERIEARLRLVRESDYFTFLGLDEAATNVEVERAAQRLLREFDSPEIAGEAGLSGELKLIRRIVSEAELVLGTSSRRARYARALARNRRGQ